MVVAGKYELGKLVGDCPEARTFAALDIATGGAVLVHQIMTSSLRDVALRCVPGRGGVIELHGDYIVAENREGPVNVREWLESAAVAPPPASRDSGEERFTRVGAWRVPSAFSAPPPPKVEAVPPPPAATEKPGEFTSMFRAPEAPLSPPPPPAAASEPGEFTRIFQASPPVARPAAPAAPPVRPAAPAPAPPAGKPGEFTAYFQSPLGSKPFEESRMPSHAPTAAPAAPPPGEYTRLFQMPAPVSQPPAAGSGATHVFVTPAAPAAQPQAPVAEGPSDFTRIIRSSTPPAPEPRPAEPAASPPPEPVSRRAGVPVALVVVLSAMAVLAIGMILFFALRR
ncbi:MAG TPA: hypothetical protein VLH09_01935 [Bryobacteraceae bacterium]|nr:hypothetical protein [Bryobacteraceae bacterium]